MKMLQLNNQEAYRIAIRMLGRRSYSENEIRIKLSTYGFNSDIINETINILLRNCYIDDNALCTSLFETLCRSNKYSLKTIVMKLKQRKIAEEYIHRVITKYDYAAETEAALKIIKKRFKQTNLVDVDKIKLRRYLIDRGFSSQSISNVLRNLE